MTPTASIFIFTAIILSMVFALVIFSIFFMILYATFFPINIFMRTIKKFLDFEI